MSKRVAQAERADEMISCLVAAEALDGLSVRIHNPVVGDADGGAALGFGEAVVGCRRGREDLDDKREGAPSMPRAETRLGSVTTTRSGWTTSWG